MMNRHSRSRLLALALITTLAACDGNSQDGGQSAGTTTGGAATGGGTTGGGTTGGTTGSSTTGGGTTGGSSTGGTSTGGSSTGGTTGGSTTGSSTTGGGTTGSSTTGGGTTGGTSTGGTTGGGTTGGTGSGNAAQCFDGLYAVSGTKIVASFQTTSGSTVTTTDYQQVIGTSTLNGVPVMTAAGPVNVSGATSSSSNVTQYYQLDTTAKTLTTFGVDTSTTSPVSVQTQSRFSPPEVYPSNLNPGESVTVNSTITTTGTASGITIPATNVQTKVVRTFVGIESVTVPAGTFSSCKYTDQTTTTTQGVTSNSTATLWMFGNGINLKTQSGDGTVSVLLSATINGSPIH